MPDVRYNLVRFTPNSGGQPVYLTLTDDWTISGGLAPNLVTAVVPWTEAAKLPQQLPDALPGRVEFLFTTATVPDVTLHMWFLVDITVSRIGVPQGGSSIVPLEYALTFADHRHAFVPPRGARLRDGSVNASTLPPGSTLLTNGELILKCLNALNYEGATVAPGVVPATVDGVEPARDLEWDDAPAAEELSRLLQHCGHAYCPLADGGATIVQPNTGNPPSVPTERLSFALQAQVMDRRPRFVAFTSAPAPQIITITPAWNSSALKWEFVCQDPLDNGRWKPVDQVVSGGAATQLRKGLPNVPAEHRDQISRQLFRCVRMTGPPGGSPPPRFDRRQCSILREVYYPDGTTHEPYLTATVAAQDQETSAWVNRGDRVRVQSSVAHEGVIVFEERLGTIDGTEKPDRDPYFTPMAAGAIKPYLSIEDWDGATSRRKFATFAFQRAEGAVTALTESLATARLSNYRSDTAVYNAPELRRVVVDDQFGTAAADNRAALQAKAMQYASLLLADEGVQEQIIEATGFLAVELGGRVCEVRYNQRDCKTLIIIDAWHVPSRAGGATPDATEAGPGLAARRQRVREPQAAKESARPAQRQAASTGDRQPVESVPIDRPQPRGFTPILVTVSGPVDGQLGLYTAKSISCRLNTSPSGNLSIAMLGTQPASDDVLLEFTGDIGGTSPGGLKAGDVIAAWAGPVQQSDGKLIAIAAGPRMKKKNIVTNWECANGTPQVTKEDVWVFDV